MRWHGFLDLQNNFSISPTGGWSLCLATFNRLDSLAVCIRCALDQTLPPREIIIADASPDWKTNRDHISRIVGDDAANVRLSYLQSLVASSCVQRNLAINKATSDVIFLLDDDSYMDRYCAEEVMAIYRKDVGRKVAGVAIGNLDAPPTSTSGTGIEKTETKESAPDRRAVLKKFLPRKVAKFVYAEIFMLEMTARFIPFDGSFRVAPRAEVDALGMRDVTPIAVLEGCRATVRRDVAQKELFEENFLRYAPGGDMNCTYRYSRHGMLLKTSRAKLYHFEAAPNRFKRQLLMTLKMMNLTFGIKTRSSNKFRDIPRLYILYVRLLVAAVLKDTLMRRLAFHESRGVLAALPLSVSILFRKDDTVAEWYREMQNRLFERHGLSRSGRSLP